MSEIPYLDKRSTIQFPYCLTIPTSAQASAVVGVQLVLQLIRIYLEFRVVAVFT